MPRINWVSPFKSLKFENFNSIFPFEKSTGNKILATKLKSKICSKSYRPSRQLYTLYPVLTLHPLYVTKICSPGYGIRFFHPWTITLHTGWKVIFCKASYIKNIRCRILHAKLASAIAMALVAHYVTVWLAYRYTMLNPHLYNHRLTSCATRGPY